MTYFTRPGEVNGIVWRLLDVRRREDVAAVIDVFRPEVIINAAACQAD
ncbi:hypothetical protein [Streptosporangium canum]